MKAPTKLSMEFIKSAAAVSSWGDETDAILLLLKVSEASCKACILDPLEAHEEHLTDSSKGGP